MKHTKKNIYLYLTFSLPATVLLVVIWELITPSVGANIGAGLMVILGLILSLTGLIGLVLTGSPKVRKRAAILLIALVVLLPSVALLTENESNKQFCSEKRDHNEAIFEESVPLCRKYFPEFNYKIVE